MRARVSKKDIMQAILRAGSIADKKSVVPILSHVLLEFKDSLLCLKSTDLDHSIIENVSAEVDTFGSVAVPAGVLSDIIRKVQDGAMLEFVLSDKGGKLIVSAGKSKFELSTLDYNDFPNIDKIDNACNFTLNAAEFNKIITRTKFSMSSEESRHNLNGVNITKDGNILRAVTTDGHRLSLSEISENSQDVMQSIIVSKKTVFEVKKILDATEGQFTFSFSENQVQFAFEKIVFISKLVDGKFPEYKRVIPDMDGDFFVVNRCNFLQIIDRVAVMSDEKVRSVKLEIADGMLSVYVANSRLGSGRDEVGVTCDAQISWSAGFNANYLLDVAQAVNCENLKVFIKDALSSILILDEENADSLFVVMPMRV